MINARVRGRLSGLTLTGAQVLELAEGLVKIDEETREGEASFVCKYADETIADGEYGVELHVVVRKHEGSKPDVSDDLDISE